MFNMLVSNKISLAIAMTSLMTLSGCQNYIQPTPPSPSQQIAEKNNFSIQGKIGVKTTQQSGSAFFDWQQQGDAFNIDLTGILGIGKTHIEGTAHQVTLTSARTGTITSDSPEELLEQATGWQAPITYLVSWVQGQPATKKPVLERDSQQRITQIKEEGWIISLSYNGLNNLPNKLILQQPLSSQLENRITMVIQNR